MSAARKFRVSVSRGALCLERECAEAEMDGTARALLKMLRSIARDYPEVRDTPRVDHVGAAHQFDPWDGDDEGRRRMGFIR